LRKKELSLEEGLRSHSFLFQIVSLISFHFSKIFYAVCSK
jgi:hypothetical protein